MSEKKFDFTIEELGECKFDSPIELSNVVGDHKANYVKDDSFVRNNIKVFDKSEPDDLTVANLLQKAGPREKIYFDPEKVNAGICTGGGRDSGDRALLVETLRRAFDSRFPIRLPGIFRGKRLRHNHARSVQC